MTTAEVLDELAAARARLARARDNAMTLHAYRSTLTDRHAREHADDNCRQVAAYITITETRIRELEDLCPPLWSHPSV